MVPSCRTVSCPKSPLCSPACPCLCLQEAAESWLSPGSFPRMPCSQYRDVAFSSGFLSLIRIHEARAGEVAPWLKETFALLGGPRFYSQPRACQLTSICNSSPRGSGTSFGPCGHQAHTWCRDMHAGQTSMHIK